MSDFHSFVRGKRVCLVGPAPVNIGRGEGKKIDAFDVVVKTGPAILINEKTYFADYGYRCDVLYMNATFCRALHTPPILDMKSKGLKFIRARINLEQLIKPLSVHFNVHVLDASFINQIFTESLALMGTIATLDILKGEPTELCLTGFDFNTSRGASMEKVLRPGASKFDEYFPGYVDLIKKDMSRTRDTGDAHDHEADTRLLKNLYDAGKITMPDFVAKKMHLLLKYADEARMEKQ